MGLSYQKSPPLPRLWWAGAKIKSPPLVRGGAEPQKQLETQIYFFTAFCRHIRRNHRSHIRRTSFRMIRRRNYRNRSHRIFRRNDTCRRTSIHRARVCRSLR